MNEYLLKEKNMFTKKDLKTGMRLTFASGKTAIVAIGHDYGDVVIYGHSSFQYLNRTIIGGGDRYSIIKVEKPTNQMCIFNDNTSFSTIWEYEEPTKEMTVADIEAALGYKVKVVK